MFQKDICCHELFHQEHIWSDGLIPPMNFLLHELIPPMDFCLLSYLLVNFFGTTFLSLQLFFDIEFFEKDETSRQQKKKRFYCCYVNKMTHATKMQLNSLATTLATKKTSLKRPFLEKKYISY